MKWILRILIFAICITIGVGYFIRHEDYSRGETWIGIAVAVAFFIFMPLFLAHRWKGKRLEDYTLSPENMEKMRETLGENSTRKKN